MPGLIDWWRSMEDVLEDVRRWWAEHRGRGQYVSVQAVRRAEMRVELERRRREALDRPRRRRNECEAP